MNLLMLLLLLCSALATFIGNLMILVAAFRQSILWGVATLLLPFVQLFFLIRHWDVAKKGFYVGLIGAFVLMGTIFCLPNRDEYMGGEWKKAFANASHDASSNQSEIKELTDQIQLKRDAIAQLEGEFSQNSATLASQYREITAKRQALNTGDPAAVTQFNEDAAAYHQLNNRVKQMTQSIATAKQELDDLLKQRSKLQAAAPSGMQNPSSLTPPPVAPPAN